MATSQPPTRQRVTGRQGSKRTLQLGDFPIAGPQGGHKTQLQDGRNHFIQAHGQAQAPSAAEVIDLTGPSQPPSQRKQSGPAVTTPIVPVEAVSLSTGDRMEKGGNTERQAVKGNQQGPTEDLPQSSTTVLNSRHKRRFGMGSQSQAQPTPSPSFVNPSSIQPASRGPATPTLPWGAGGTRQRQFQPQPLKPAVAPSASKRDNRPKPYVLEVPPIAPGLPNPHKKHADFFPWKGNHPEDQVTDVHARNGQFDRLPIKVTNEHQTARPALQQVLKTKTGIPLLQSLFLTVLEKRQSYGRITAPSTFKPPPRVTLADHKRETWLRDLSNPLVPLRRLSRTIPHGIRGRILLDHCSSKNIPPSRAIWLARCVGANELRGLKRKGASSLAFGNEAKWIKEWTQHVVQFIDKAASECGQTSDSSWKKKMVYAIRLSAHLYSENLLDRTTFLEWYLSFLEIPNLDTLPLGLLMSSIYWRDLLRTRRFGHRFAEALLGKVQAIMESDDQEIYLPLLRRLSILITEILLKHMESLIIPKTWVRYKITLESCVDRTDPAVERCLQLVIQRNNNLCSPAETKRNDPHISQQRRMIDTLDSVVAPFNLIELSLTCSSLLPDHTDFVQCLCEWAVTSLRVGVYRVYIAVAILRQKARAGNDIQGPILTFLERFARSVVGNKNNVYLLISELVRTKNFPLASYFKWLIARGILLPFTTMEKDHPCHVRLLAEIPISGAPQHIKNLRNSLLRGTGFSVDIEAETLQQVKNLLSKRIGGILSKQHPPPPLTAKFETGELDIIHSLSRNLISEVTTWIGGSVRRHVVEGAPVGRDNWRDLSIEVGISAITLPQFTMIRKVLEECEDFIVLADVVKQVASSDISGVLSSAADTVSYNIKAFSVLGVVDEILQCLFKRYNKLQLRRNIEKFVVASLVDLAAFPDCNQEIRKQLQHDLDTYEQRYPRASFAHSPLSDNEFLNIMHEGDGDCNEEMDRLLQNGASMDKQTLSRIFETMVSRIDSSLGENVGYARFSFSSLIKLRQFGPVNFDLLAHGWVMRIFQSIPSRHSLLDTLSPLIAGSCLDLGGIVASSLEFLNANSGKEKLSGSAALELAVQVLDLIVGSALEYSTLTDQEIYSFRRKRQVFEQKSPVTLIKIIYRSIELCVAYGNYEFENRLRNLIISKPIVYSLRSISTFQPATLIANLLDPLSKDSKPALLKWLRILIDHLLDDHDSSDLTDPDADVQVSRLLQLANDFSIQLCQLKMRIIFDAEKTNPLFENGSTLTQTFFRGIASAFKEKGSIWSDLVSVLDDNCARQVRVHAEQIFLQSMTFPMPLEPNDRGENNESLARALMAVIEATSTSINTRVGPVISSALVEKLNMLISYIMPTSNENAENDRMMDPPPSPRDLFWESRCWLILFLRIIILHKSAFSNSKVGMSDQARMVVGLCALLQNEYLQADEPLFDHVLDVTSFLIDELPEESRALIRRFFRYKKQTPRISYLLGTSDCSADWLKATRGGTGTSGLGGKLIDFPVKSWERLADPTPVIGENDTSLSLTLFRTRKTKCVKMEGEKFGLGIGGGGGVFG